MMEVDARAELISVIERLDDEDVDAMLDVASSLLMESETLSPEEYAAVQRGAEQIARGESISLEELEKRLFG